MHSTNNINDSYLGSGLILRRSIRKYGEKNFKREILEFCDNREMLARREKEIVTQQLINKKMCMNLKLGGEGGWKDKEHQIKCSLAGGAALAKKVKEDKFFLDKLKKMGSIRMKQINKEKTKFDNFKGLKHTTETKNKISKSLKGKGLKESNSQYGTMWVTDGTNNKKIKISDIIPRGYYKGRK
jgi:hypothetical protein